MRTTAKRSPAKSRRRTARRAPTPKPYHHGDLRRVLIDAALQLVGEGGPDAVSVREAARRAGVSPGAPFRHFPSRDALMTAVAEEAQRRFRAEIEAALSEAPASDPLAKFRCLGLAYLRWAMRNPTHFEIISSRRFFDHDRAANVSRDNTELIDMTERTLAELEADVRNGARGLKIYKDLGMEFKDEQGKRIAIDDPRLNAIWDKCAALHIPVLIHSADPPSFWDPMDKYNERWLELKTHPGRKRENTNPASWKTIIGEQHHIFRAHPNTQFIAAHFGWLANDLSSLGKLLDECPNVSVEIAAIIAELGRQPRQARDFFIKYQDRILFGKDSWVPSEYMTYFRVLETADEYFPYHKKYHAFWRMYGLALPDEVLKKVYYKNALRIIPGLDKSRFPQ